jgi:hypothetical protein
MKGKLLHQKIPRHRYQIPEQIYAWVRCKVTLTMWWTTLETHHIRMWSILCTNIYIYTYINTRALAHRKTSCRWQCFCFLDQKEIPPWQKLRDPCQPYKSRILPPIPFQLSMPCQATVPIGFAVLH